MTTEKLDHWNEDVKKCSLFVQATSESKIAIFDIGTRSVKLLVAPTTPPTEFSDNTFWTVGYPLNLGQAVDMRSQRLRLDDWRAKQVLSFVRLHAANLKKLGVTEIHLIGTAVLRWSHNNLSDIQKLFKDEVGYEVEVMSQDTEGALSLLLLPEILKRRKKDFVFNDDDFVMLMDQGGGSLEVNWIRWKDWTDWSQHTAISPNVHQLRFPTLGTTSLKKEFFQMDANFVYSDPEKNTTLLAHQMAVITRWINQELSKQWSEVEHSVAGNHIHLFGLGTAITEITNGNSYKKHGKSISRDHIEGSLVKILDSIHGNSETAASLFSYLNKKSGKYSSKGSAMKELDRNLAILYGLPVFYSILTRLNADSVTINGYGLRYAYYLWITLYDKRPLPLRN